MQRLPQHANNNINIYTYQVFIAKVDKQDYLEFEMKLRFLCHRRMKIIATTDIYQCFMDN